MSEPMIDPEATPNAPMPGKALAEVIKIDETLIRGHLDKVVRESVQETLNALLDAEANQLCGARRYERSSERVDTRAGHYERQLHTKAGEVKLGVPKLRNVPFEAAIIASCRWCGRTRKVRRAQKRDRSKAPRCLLASDRPPEVTFQTSPWVFVVSVSTWL